MSEQESAISGGFFYCPASPTKTTFSPWTMDPPPGLPSVLPPPRPNGATRENSHPRSAMRRSSPSIGLHDRPKSVRLLGTCDEAELARALLTPPPVESKSSSALDRLRLSLQPTFSNARRSFRGRRPTSDPKSRSRHPTSPRSGSPSKSSRRSSIRRTIVTPADAEWYLNLPEKAKSRHFTRDEQVLLASRCESIVLDAPTLTHNHVRTPVPVAAPVPTLAPAPQLHIPTHRRLESESTIRAATPPPRRSKRFSFETSPERRRVSTLTMVDTLADSFRWMDDSPDLNLRFSLDERPRADVPKKAPAAFTTLSPKPTRRASIRRPVRIGSKSSRSSRRRTPSITGPARPTPRHRQTMHEEAPARSSIGFELPRRRSEGPSAVADPEATYYQDPNAREKVRQFLTSPRRFDEAIEFGFPSLAEGNKENLRPETISAKAIKSPQYTEGRTFFDDETASLSENGDESSVPDSDVPRTPSDLETTFQSPHRLPSSKSSSSGSVTPQRPTIRYPSGKNIVAALGENREMTLRMTLTKPELRADEDALYGWQGRGKDDPLALDGMTPFVEASHGAPGPFGGVDGWGPPPKENGIVRKLLRRMTVTSRRVPSA